MRVLIAHADEASRTLLAATVRDAGPGLLNILATGDGREVLDLLLEDDPPEVALVDWDLPEIEGPELCRLIRDFHRGHDTWLAVLAAPRHADTADAWRAGADDCISLPATAGALRACVEKGLEEMAPRQACKAVELVCAFAEECTERPAPQPTAERRPSLEAICRRDRQTSEDRAAGLAAELRATVDPGADDDGGGSAALSARPVLSALRFEPCDGLDEPRGHATLDAVLARL